MTMIALLDTVIKNNESESIQAYFDRVDFNVVNEINECVIYEKRLRQLASISDSESIVSKEEFFDEMNKKISNEYGKENDRNIVSLYRGRTRRFAVIEDELKQDMKILGNVMIIQDNLITRHHYDRSSSIKVIIHRFSLFGGAPAIFFP